MFSKNIQKSIKKLTLLRLWVYYNSVKTYLFTKINNENSSRKSVNNDNVVI